MTTGRLALRAVAVVLLVALVALEVHLLTRPRPAPQVVQPADLAASAARPLPARQAKHPRDILLITVDTLRSDHLGLYGYERPTSPSIDGYFGDAQVFERAYTTQANTSPSVVSMLTGLYPARHGVRLLYQRVSGDVHTLPDHLGAAGYETAAVVSNIVLTEEAIGLSTRFDHYDDFVDEREMNRDIFERRASRTTEAALHWLDHVRQPDRPHLLWVHYIDPHAPYDAPVEERPRDFTHQGTQPFDLERMEDYARIPGITDGLEYIDRYDEEIAYTDQEIGRLLAAYERHGLLEDAIVVFTSDHGETMMEHEEYFDHGFHVWEPIVRIPLAVRWPEGQSERVSVPVSLADVTPTLLDAVGLAVPDGLDGVRLTDPPPGRSLSMEATDLAAPQQRALVKGTTKWYATIEGDRTISARWRTDLEADPAERRRTPWADRGPGSVLERWIVEDPDAAGRPEELLWGEVIEQGKVTPGRTEEQLRALRALGYVQ